MTIEINRPELEALIRHRLQEGQFGSVEDMLLDALQEPKQQDASASTRPGRKSLARLFAESPFKGLNLKFERDSDTGRAVEL
jgi:hypothetical protein